MNNIHFIAAVNLLSNFPTKLEVFCKENYICIASANCSVTLTNENKVLYNHVAGGSNPSVEEWEELVHEDLAKING